MSKLKTLQELTITDNFLFGAVMLDPENCKELLERILDLSIDHVEVITEKSLVYHPEYKGVRLDVYAKDPAGSRFNVEMQVRKTPLGKRSRYYHSQIDMDLLQTGLPYEKLPDSYVIFICDYDPFGDKKYRYVFRQACDNNPNAKLEDGRYTIVLSNRGQNADEVPEELVQFLKFTTASLEESENEFQDEYVCKLQKSIQKIKSSREMGGRYMIFQEMMQEQREEGRKEERKQLAIKMHQQGYGDNAIAKLTEVSVEELKKWFTKHPV